MLYVHNHYTAYLAFQLPLLDFLVKSFVLLQQTKH